MSIPKISGFNISAPQPIDTRIIATNSTVRTSMSYLVVYDGLKVFQTDDRKTYIFNGSKFLANGGTQSAVSTSWDVDNGGGVLQYNSISSFPNIGDPTILYVDQSTKLSYYWATQSSTYSCTVDIFTYNPTVYLGPSYSFGKYTNGSVIPAIGKTPQQVILDAISQPLNPTVNISVLPVSVPYNTSSIIATISVSYTINSAGATAISGSVSYGTTSPNTFLVKKVGPLSSYTNTFTQSITYSQLTPTTIYYNYIVTDTQGAQNSATTQINMSNYSSPNLSLSATRVNQQSGETDYIREIGNIGTTLSSNAITINSPLVPLSYYQLSYSNDGTNYSNIGSTVSINSGSSITPTYNNSLSATTTSGYFRLIVTDIKQSNTITTNQIIFYYPYYYYKSTVLYSSSTIASWVSIGGTVSKVIANTSGSININGLSSPNNQYLYIIVPRSLSTWANPLLSSDTGLMTGSYNSYTSNISTIYWTNKTYYIYISTTPITNPSATSGYNYN